MKKVSTDFIFAGALLLLTGLSLQSSAPQKSLRRFELRSLAPEFSKLISTDAKLTTVGTGFGFTEGPLWDGAGFLYVSDETRNKIVRLRLDGRTETLIELGDPDGNTFDSEMRLIDCASVLRAIIRIDSSGHYKTIADRFEGKRFNSPNDVVLGPDGALYFTDPTLDLPEGQKQELPFEGVYRLGAKGDVRLLTKDLAQPNGLAFSPDSKRFYVDDSERRNIRVYDFRLDGTIANGRVFGEEPAETPGDKDEGVPDGMKVDESEHVYVTGPGGIWVWDAGGHHLGTVILPEPAANLAWGDADYGTLYITATTSVYSLRTNVRGFVPYLERHPARTVGTSARP